MLPGQQWRGKVSESCQKENNMSLSFIKQHECCVCFCDGMYVYMSWSVVCASVCVCVCTPLLIPMSCHGASMIMYWMRFDMTGESLSVCERLYLINCLSREQTSVDLHPSKGQLSEPL